MGSGRLARIERKHAGGQGKHLFSQNGMWHVADIIAGIGTKFVDGASQNKDRQRGDAGVQFGNKGRPADAGEVMPRNHQSQAVRKLWLLNQAQRFRGIGYPTDVGEAPFQNRLADERLERVVIHQ